MEVKMDVCPVFKQGCPFKDRESTESQSSSPTVGLLAGDKFKQCPLSKHVKNVIEKVSSD